MSPFYSWKMENYLLPNYQLSCLELLQSLVVSEYGLRHLEQARLDVECRWGHRLVACVHFTPVLGQLAMLVEWIASRILSRITLNEMLFEGTQDDCSGTAAPHRVLQVIDRIHQCRERGILFNRGKVSGSIHGGVCSAMALDFADQFFKLRKARPITGHSGDFFLKTIRSLGAQFARSSEEMRVRQAAFNTIEVLRNAAPIDASRNKVQSLANFHGFKINHASAEIAVDSASCSQAVEREAASLPDGLYLLRTILPSNNERLEQHGHSIVYFKERGEGLLYDPNVGARYMKNISHLPVLSQSLANYLERFHTSRARFYRLSETA